MAGSGEGNGMYVLNVIVAVVLGVGFMMVGIGKLVDIKPMAKTREHLGLPIGLFRVIGGLEVFGGAGVFLGLHHDLPVIGVLAAVGLIGMTIGAAYYHQKADDAMKDWLPSVMMGSIAIFLCDPAHRHGMTAPILDLPNATRRVWARAAWD